jgi:hypothetical protein
VKRAVGFPSGLRGLGRAGRMMGVDRYFGCIAALTLHPNSVIPGSRKSAPRNDG